MQPSAQRYKEVTTREAKQEETKEVKNAKGKTVRTVLEVTQEVNEEAQALKPYLVQNQHQHGFAYANWVDGKEYVSAYFIQATKWTSCVPFLSQSTKSNKVPLKQCVSYKMTYNCYQKDCPHGDKECEAKYTDSSRAFLHTHKSECGEMHEVLINMI